MTMNPEQSEAVEAKPRKSHLWQKGQSGNPSGKAKGTVSLAHALRRQLTHQNATDIARKLIELAKSGDTQALKILFDRIEGRVTTDGVFVNVIQNSHESTTAKLDFDAEAYRKLLSGLVGLPGSNGSEEPAYPALPDATPGAIPEPC